MILLAPNQWICLLAGATKMRWRIFLIINLGGTVVRVVLIWLLGKAFEEPIGAVNDWIGEHRWQLTAVTITLVTLGALRSARKGMSQFETPSELEEELAEASEPDDATPPATG
jgi:membrane protein DedA with SNARE-associated domain